MKAPIVNAPESGGAARTSRAATFGGFAMLRRMHLGMRARADRAAGHDAGPAVARSGPCAPVSPGGGLFRRLAGDAAVAGLGAVAVAGDPVREEDLAGLPEPARRYLRQSGVLGRPPDWSFVLHSRGRFRLRRGWPAMPCEAWQYNSALGVARVFWMRINAGPIAMIGRDSYLAGRGVMHGRLAGMLTVVNGSGPQYDVSELVTFLNDAVLFAPSMLLRLPVSWAAAGDGAFDIGLADRDNQVTARVYLDDHDLPCDFSTNDRYSDSGRGPVRTRWHTPVGGWCKAGGRWRPSRGSAVWDLPDRPLTYAEFTFGPGDVRYNVAPTDLGAASRHDPT